MNQSDFKRKLATLAGFWGVAAVVIILGPNWLDAVIMGSSLPIGFLIGRYA